MDAVTEPRSGTPVRVGLVGAGPWAQAVHAPAFAAGGGTRLEAVWARRPEAASALAALHGARAVARIDELYDCCDAIVFSVPPDVQADLAIGAARAGRTLVLEKPVGATLLQAERLAEVVGECDVPSLVVLSWRYSAAVRSFLDAAGRFDAFGGRGSFFLPSFLGGPFATPWRLASGPLLDLGPHVVDLLDAALGPVVDVRAAGDRLRWVTLTMEHASGAVSQAAMCGHTQLDPMRSGVELYGLEGVVEVDCAAAVRDRGWVATLRAEVVRLVGGGSSVVDSSVVDVARGVHVQRIIEAAMQQLR